MDKLVPEAEELLMRFRTAGETGISVADLEVLLPDGKYEYCMPFLSAAGYIVISDWSEPDKEYVRMGAVHSGSPAAFRITYAGIRYLTMRDQQNYQRAERKRAKKNKKAQERENKIKNIRKRKSVSVFLKLISTLISFFLQHLNEVPTWFQSHFHG